ncbi:MAG: protein kinase [Burkholderiales bacterium]|nr:protein kinase [Burkholderiales bacterium]
MRKSIGRFELKKLLGEGAQGMVYLAFDPKLDRQVAIKVLETGAEFSRVSDEAKIVAKLRHRNIVTLFDAGEEEGVPYLVFEYVEGKTLEREIREEGRFSEKVALGIALQILEGLEEAHRFGIIHRDIKPANIMLDREGVPRIMDFGIAGHFRAEGENQFLMGSPLYMAPEYVSKGIFGPQSDIFSAGMLLYVMLTGKSPVEGSSMEQVLKNISTKKSPPPSSMNPEIDEQIDSIVLKAVSLDPSDRYREAGAMMTDIRAYLEPAPATREGNQSTLEFLLRKMKRKSDFPALSQAIGAVNRIVSSDRESIANLANVILRDFSLTNKLIRLVNAAVYGQFGGSISTVSRAIVILGFDTVRNVAITLMLFEHLQNRSQAAKLRDEIISTFFSGVLARELAPKGNIRDSEEAVICAMFFNLGKLLSMFYFPEESAEIEKLAEAMAEEDAAVSVLGIGFEELGVGVARAWHFPDSIVSSMRRIGSAKVREPDSESGRLRVLANLSNELRAIAQQGEAEEGKLNELVLRYREAAPVSAKMLKKAVDESMKKFMIETKILGIDGRESLFLEKVRKWSGVPEEERKSAEEEFAKTVKVENLVASGAGKQDSCTMLASGIQEITNVLVEEFDLNDLLRMVLETIYRSMDFSRVMMCIRDVKQNFMAGRFGFGKDIGTVTKNFRFQMKGEPDVFRVCLEQGVDLFIYDVDAENIRQSIPTWFRTGIGAKSFILFPIIVDRKPIGLIYADQVEAGRLKVDQKELSLLKTMRNQAVLAIRQKL